MPAACTCMRMFPMDCSAGPAPQHMQRAPGCIKVLECHRACFDEHQPTRTSTNSCAHMRLHAQAQHQICVTCLSGSSSSSSSMMASNRLAHLTTQAHMHTHMHMCSHTDTHTQNTHGHMCTNTCTSRTLGSVTPMASVSWLGSTSRVLARPAAGVVLKPRHSVQSRDASEASACGSSGASGWKPRPCARAAGGRVDAFRGEGETCVLWHACLQE